MQSELRAIESRLSQLSDKMSEMAVDLALIKHDASLFRQIVKYVCTIVSGTAVGISIYYATH
jgi:hypothetical protein